MRRGLCIVMVFLLAMVPSLGAGPGSIVGWGNDSLGQASPPAGTDYQAIAGGGTHSVALKMDGSIVDWGDNAAGQLDNTPAGTDYQAIAAGGLHSLALKTDGSIVGWGYNYYGQASPPAGTDYKAIAAGYMHSVALKTDGSIVAWGNNEQGETSPPTGNDYVAISAGDWHNLALKTDGSIVGWGGNGYGERIPPAGTDYQAIAAGGYHSLALKTDGSMVCWGAIFYAEEGYDYQAIAAGEYHNLALKTDGSIVTWGSSSYGLGIPPSGTDYLAIAAGGHHSLALKAVPTPTMTPTSASTEVPTATPSSTPTAASPPSQTPTQTPTMTSTRMPSTTPIQTCTPTPVASISGWSQVSSNQPVSGLLLYGDKSSAGKEMGGLPGCLTPSTTHYLAHFASGPRWYTGVAVADPSVTEAHVTFIAYSDSGVSLGASSLTVPGVGKESALVSQLFTPAVNGTGWIKVMSDVPVVVFDLYGDMISGGIGALASSQLGSTLTLAHFVHSSRWWTGITILNPYATSVDVALKAYGDAGNILDQRFSTISARSKLVGMVEALMPGTANKSGWISVESTGGDVAGLLVYGDKTATPNRIAALPAVPAATSLNLSNFYRNTEWWTGMALVNPSETMTATLTLTAYAPDGSQIDQKTQPLGTLNKLVGMVNTIFSLGGNTEGWIQVTSTEPVVGLEILNADDVTREAWGLAAIESQPADLNVYLPHQVVNSRWWTLLALANPNGTEAAVNLSARNDDGTELKGVVKSIPLTGRIADYLREMFGL